MLRAFPSNVREEPRLLLVILATWAVVSFGWLVVLPIAELFGAERPRLIAEIFIMPRDVALRTRDVLVAIGIALLPILTLASLLMGRAIVAGLRPASVARPPSRAFAWILLVSFPLMALEVVSVLYSYASLREGEVQPSWYATCVVPATYGLGAVTLIVLCGGTRALAAAPRRWAAFAGLVVVALALTTAGTSIGDALVYPAPAWLPGELPSARDDARMALTYALLALPGTLTLAFAVAWFVYRQPPRAVAAAPVTRPVRIPRRQPARGRQAGAK